MRRSALACAAVLLLAGTLTACGDDGDPSGEASSSDSTSPTAAPTSGPTSGPTAGTTPSPTATTPAPTTTVTGADAAFCQAALDAGLASNVKALRTAIAVLLTTLPERADAGVRDGLVLLDDFYGEAEDLASAGEAYADASDAEQKKMDVYFTFQSSTCD